MRFYDIAMYMFIFNLSLSFLFTATSSYTSASYGGVDFMGEAEMQEAERTITSSITEEYAPLFSELNWLVENIVIAIWALNTMIVWLEKSTILFPVLWYEISAPYVSGTVWMLFITLLSLPLYFVYIMGLIQWAAGRSTKEVQ